MLDEKNKTFTKYYLNPDDQPKIVDEFEKGLKLNKIINYPKPISYDKNSIQYEGLEIKYSLYDLLKKNKLVAGDFKKIGQYLRKMHDCNISHGDFTPSNVVFSKDDRIFFIDASFSRYNTNNEVQKSVGNIYDDISLMFMHLKASKPLYKLWLFFVSNKKLKDAFWEGYLNKNETFDEIEYLNRENAAIDNNIKCYWESRGFFAFNYLHIISLKIFKLLNNLKIRRIMRRS